MRETALEKGVCSIDFLQGFSISMTTPLFWERL